MAGADLPYFITPDNLQSGGKGTVRRRTVLRGQLTDDLTDAGESDTQRHIHLLCMRAKW